jgi:membrane-associated protein
MLISPETIVEGGGLLVITFVVFAETGLLVGFFLPGDTLLVAAGIFAAQGNLPLGALLFCLAAAAILGYQLGYSIGNYTGPRLFHRKDGVLFKEAYIARTQDFFNRHGGKTVLLARFVPVVRTIVPLVAGIGKMSKRRFMAYNIAGGILWTFGLTLAAYWLGQRIPDLDKFLLPMLGLAVVLTTGPIVFQIARSPAGRRELKNALRDEYVYFRNRRKK